MKVHPNLIANVNYRNDRKLEKQHAVLRFLRQHLWSSQNILQEVMQLKSRQAAHKSLSQMELIGLIRSYQYSALGGNLTLWGITPHGQAMAFNPSKEEPYSVYFEPSRISEQNIRHQLDLQKLRIIAEASGWHSWMDGDRFGNLDKNTKRPDAVVKNAHGVIHSIECERTFKSLKRYEQILISYLRMLRVGHVSRVVWVSPTQDMSERLKKIITSIQAVKIAGQRVLIDPAKHHINLHFCSYDQWPHFELIGRE